MNNERIQRLHKFMRDFKKFLRDNYYDIDDKDIQGYLRGLVHFNVNESKEKIMTRKERIRIEAEDSAFALEGDIGTAPHSREAIIDYFIDIVEWADRTMLDKVYDFIIANAYKYGKVKFVDDRATFDFRMNTFLNDLKQAVEIGE